MNDDTKNMSEVKALSVDESINLFINNLVIEAKVAEKLEGNEDVLTEFKKDLRNRFENRLNATILSQIPKDKMNEFESILDSDDKEIMQNYCQKNIPNFSELIAAEFLNFRNRYVENNK
jgi:hypothetical protein